MVAAVYTAPQGGQVMHIAIAMQGENTRHMAVEQMPCGYRLWKKISRREFIENE
jgi:hypothetical protein